MLDCRVTFSKPGDAQPGELSFRNEASAQLFVNTFKRQYPEGFIEVRSQACGCCCANCCPPEHDAEMRVWENLAIV